MKSFLIFLLTFGLIISIAFNYFLLQDSLNVTQIIKPLSSSNSISPQITQTPQIHQENVVLGTSSTLNENDLEQIVQNIQGSYSIYIKNVGTGEFIALNPNNQYYAASLYKLPYAINVLRAVEKGEISLSDTVALEVTDIQDGSGTIRNSQIGAEFTIEELLTILIKESDNTAQAMLLKLIPNTNVGFSVGVVDEEKFPISMNVSSEEYINILENLAKGAYLSPTSTNFLLDIMTNTAFEDRISLGIDQNLAFSHKIGNWAETGSWHDCGIVAPISSTTNLNQTYAVCVFSNETSFQEVVQVSKSVGELVSEQY